MTFLPGFRICFGMDGDGDCEGLAYPFHSLNNRLRPVTTTILSFQQETLGFMKNLIENSVY